MSTWGDLGRTGSCCGYPPTSRPGREETQAPLVRKQVLRGKAPGRLLRKRPRGPPRHAIGVGPHRSSRPGLSTPVPPVGKPAGSESWPRSHREEMQP